MVGPNLKYCSYLLEAQLAHVFVPEKKIKSATSQIAECKTELQQAKRIRKNRQGEITLLKDGDQYDPYYTSAQCFWYWHLLRPNLKPSCTNNYFEFQQFPLSSDKIRYLWYFAWHNKYCIYYILKCDWQQLVELEFILWNPSFVWPWILLAHALRSKFKVIRLCDYNFTYMHL